MVSASSGKALAIDGAGSGLCKIKHVGVLATTNSRYRRLVVLGNNIPTPTTFPLLVLELRTQSDL